MADPKYVPIYVRANAGCSTNFSKSMFTHMFKKFLLPKLQARREILMKDKTRKRTPRIVLTLDYATCHDLQAMREMDPYILILGLPKRCTSIVQEC